MHIAPAFLALASDNTNMSFIITYRVANMRALIYQRDRWAHEVVSIIYINIFTIAIYISLLPPRQNLLHTALVLA